MRLWIYPANPNFIVEKKVGKQLKSSIAYAKQLPKRNFICWVSKSHPQPVSLARELNCLITLKFTVGIVPAENSSGRAIGISFWSHRRRYIYWAQKRPKVVLVSARAPRGVVQVAQALPVWALNDFWSHPFFGGMPPKGYCVMISSLLSWPRLSWFSLCRIFFTHVCCSSPWWDDVLERNCIWSLW